LFSACVPPVPGVRSDSKEVWEQGPKSECPSRAPMAAMRPKRRYARMKVLIGVDPHKTSVAIAAVDEALGELVERAAFPQNHDGLRALDRWAKRFGERRWAVENAGGLGRHLAMRLAAAGESVVDVPPKLSARVRVLSSGNARKNDGLDALATALCPPRATNGWRRCCVPSGAVYGCAWINLLRTSMAVRNLSSNLTKRSRRAASRGGDVASMALASALEMRREGARLGTLPKPSALSFTIVHTTTHSR
jgi:transposase